MERIVFWFGDSSAAAAFGAPANRNETISIRIPGRFRFPPKNASQKIS
jgi:hypothetical protein